MSQNNSPPSVQKRARVVKNLSTQKSIHIEIHKFSFHAVEDYSVLARKGSILPHLFMRPYSIGKCETFPNGVTVYKCIVDDCDQVTVEKAGENVTSDLLNHLLEEHFNKDGHLTLIQKAENSTGERGNSVYEYVCMVVRSGLPYYSFTERGASLRTDLDSFGVRVCSPNTFRKYLYEISMATVKNMFRSMRGLCGHIMSDASPIRFKNEYVDCCVTFFDAKDQFRVMNLGSKQVLGPLDTICYERVLLNVSGTWGARFAGVSDSLIAG